jgi:hypothetical protein
MISHGVGANDQEVRSPPVPASAEDSAWHCKRCVASSSRQRTDSSELGDLPRSEQPRQLMVRIGVTPSEQSPGPLGHNICRLRIFFIERSEVYVEGKTNVFC